VFCDLMMPGLSGMDLYARVRERHPKLADRFVFMTGGAFTVKSQRFLDATSNPRIEKPFDADRVHAVVEEILAQ